MSPWLVLLAIGLPFSSALSAFARLSAFSHSYNTVDGDVLFDQASPDSPTTVTLGLARLRLTAQAYQIRSNPVGLNCSTVGGLWGYATSPRAGDLSGKHGAADADATVINQRSTFASFDDVDIALSGPHSILGKSFVVFSTSGAPLGCATISLGSRRQKFAKFVDQGVTGLATFTQYGTDPTEIALDVLELSGLASSLYITRQVTQEGLAIPFNYDSKVPSAGDLSAKHGSLDSLAKYAQSFVDLDILLSGNESVTGMGVAITRVDRTVLAWATIEESYIWPRVYNYPTGPEPDPDPYFVERGSWLKSLMSVYAASILGAVAAWIGYLVYHQLVVRRLKKRVVPSPGIMDHVPSIDASTNLLMTFEEDSDKMEMRGYKDHLLGTLAFYMLHSLSVVLCIFYLIGLIDWYYGCQFDSLESLCFYGSYPLFGVTYNADLLFALWTSSLTWFIFLLLTRHSLRLWFRLPCRRSECQWVLIRIMDPPSQVVSMFPSWIVLGLRRLDYRRFFNYSQFIVPVSLTPECDRFFTFRCQRFTASDTGFARTKAEITSSLAGIQVYTRGLQTDQARNVFQKIGPNRIVVAVQSLGQAIETEFSRPFYLYQFAIYSIWMWWGYLLVAVSMLCVVLTAAVVSVAVTRSNQQTIASIAQAATKVWCLRDSQFRELSSDDLVPGDVVQLQPDSVAPADMILLSGVVVVDESGLTGESRPVRKSAIPHSGADYDPLKHGRYTLFAGTRIVQTSHGDGAKECCALVRRTGIATAKGDLIRHILYPQDMLFKYDEELPVVVGILMLFGTSCTLGAVYFLITTLDMGWLLLWIWCVFTLSQCMSPLLPLALASGPIRSSARLRDLGTFCVDPKRINISGKIRFFCFDKTGTLTKEGLDFIGVHEFRDELGGEVRDGHSNQFHSGLSEVSPLVQYGLATCHAVTALRDESLVGNEVETSMFRATGWSLVESAGQTVVTNAATSLTVVKRWEFDHTARRMSVLVRDQEGVYHVFTKGAAEAVQQGASSVPQNYSSISDAYSLQGLYVLSLGHRTLPDLSEEAAGQLERAQAEQGLEVLSLLLFRNELKPCTTAALADLRAGGVRCVMITGDHAQSGYFVAKVSGMLLPASAVWLSVVRDSQVEWVQLRPDVTELKEEGGLELNSSLPRRRKDGYTSTKDILAMDCELIVTGDAFNLLSVSGLMRDLAFRTRVFARMTPDGKVKVIELLVSFGLIMGMCGDGGNDCGALRMAHCGLALSDAEASVVSPFTSKTKSVQSVVDLLREGRASLATSLAAYKFLIGYGLLFGSLGVTAPACGVIICQLGLIFGDSVIVMGLTYAMSLTKPQAKLQPFRPTSSLLGPSTLGSLVGVFVIYMLGLLVAFLHMTSDPDYVPWPEYYVDAKANWSQGDNWESTVLWSFYVGQVSFSALTFSFGGKARQGLLSNWPVLLAFAIDHGIIGYALLAPESILSHAFHLASHQDNAPHPENEVWRQYQLDGHTSSPAMSFALRFRLWLMLIATCCLAALWEKVVVTGVGAKYFQRTRPSPRPQFCL